MATDQNTSEKNQKIMFFEKIKKLSTQQKKRTQTGSMASQDNAFKKNRSKRPILA